MSITYKMHINCQLLFTIYNVNGMTKSICLFCCTALISVTAKVSKDIRKDNTRNNLKTKKDFRALPKGAKGSPEPQ